MLTCTESWLSHYRMAQVSSQKTCFHMFFHDQTVSHLPLLDHVRSATYNELLGWMNQVLLNNRLWLWRKLGCPNQSPRRPKPGCCLRNTTGWSRLSERCDISVEFDLDLLKTPGNKNKKTTPKWRFIQQENRKWHKMTLNKPKLII